MFGTIEATNMTRMDAIDEFNKFNSLMSEYSGGHEITWAM